MFLHPLLRGSPSAIGLRLERHPVAGVLKRPLSSELRRFLLLLMLRRGRNLQATPRKPALHWVLPEKKYPVCSLRAAWVNVYHSGRIAVYVLHFQTADHAKVMSCINKDPDIPNKADLWICLCNLTNCGQCNYNCTNRFNIWQLYYSIIQRGLYAYLESRKIKMCMKINIHFTKTEKRNSAINNWQDCRQLLLTTLLLIKWII